MAKLFSQKPGKVDTSKLLGDTITELLEGFTGVAASDRKDLILSIEYIFQRLRSRRFLQALKYEWDRYREKGRIKDDYMGSEQCLQEILDFLDKDSPDEIRFALLKKIFLSAATEKICSRESAPPQQYMQLCRSLRSGEVLVLGAAYAISKRYIPDREDTSAAEWLGEVAKKSGLQHPKLVEIHERKLIEENLLTPRRHSDLSGVTLGKHFRLTDLAYGICQFIENYEEGV